MPMFEPIPVITWAVLLAIPLLLLWFVVRQRRGAPALRRIAAWEAVRGLMGRAIEEGKRVHLSLGRAGVGVASSAGAATSSAALDVQRYLSASGAAMDSVPLVTVADPLLMLAAQDTLYRAHRAQGRTANYDGTCVQLVAPEPLAYAVGAADRIDDAQIVANVMVGHQGDEYLMMGETGAQRDLLQVAGSDTLNTQAWVTATADHALLGEEILSGGAYLTRRPALIAALQVQDVLRVAAILAILVGVIVKSLT